VVNPILTRSAPVLAGLAAVLLYGVARGDASFFALLSLPIVLIFFVLTGVWALIDKGTMKSVARSGAMSILILLVLIPVLFTFGGQIKNQAWFLVWSATHPLEFNDAKSKDIILTHWDAWGFAGNDNDTYLASDPNDELANAVVAHHSPTMPSAQFNVAARWGQAHKLRCDIVWVQRLRQGFYVITTYDCTL
jgi:hypothetical protein